MGILYQWRYKIVFGLIIAYTCIACFIACSLLWNIATGNPPADFDDSVSICAIDSQLFDPRHDCSLIGQLAGKKFISNGWTKVVHRASLPGGLYVAVKTVHSNGKDVTECLRTEPYYVCYNKATDKLMREIDLLKSLRHEAIISLKYYCIKTIGNHTCMKHSAIVTEFGEPLTNIKLLQMVWKERRQLIQDLAKLVDYVSNSPIGALGLTDLRRPQCVLINNRLKLTDLDDIAVKDPYCKTNADCSGLNISISCISDRCYGYNAKLNIKKSYQEFGSYIFIPDGVPRERKKALKKLQLMWQHNNVTTKTLLSTAMSL